MQRVVWLAVVCMAAGSLVACSRAPQSPAPVLQRIGPSLLEPGTTLRVEGDGLPVGEMCEVRLSGHTFRPGLASVLVSTRWPARAVSQDAIEVKLDEQAIDALGGRGSFEGEVRVALQTHGHAALVSRGLAAHLDLSQLHVSDDSLRERARGLLEFAGIVAAEDASMVSGLEIAALQSEHKAATLGLRPGDLVTRAAGVAIHSLGDLAPPPHARSLELRVLRPGERAERVVTLQLAGLYEPDLSAEMSRLSVALGFLFCCLFLLSPLPSAAPWLNRCRWRLRSGGEQSLGLWGGEPAAPAVEQAGRRAKAASTVASMPMWLSAAGVMLVYFEPAGFLAVRSLSVYLGLLALSVTLTLMSDGGTFAQRVRTAAGIAGRMLVMGVLIACACALYGTRSFDGMVDGQGGWPTCWALLQKPALLVAFPFYVVFASRLGAATLALEAPGHAARLLVAERVLTNVVLCALGVAIFAGGWQSPRELQIDGLDPRLVGSLLFVGKAWALAWLLSIARRIDLGGSLGPRDVILGCFATVALTALWLWLPPSSGFELALGRALGASLTLSAFVTALRVSAPGQAPDVRSAAQ
jgi:hypothetical protein